MQHGHAVLHGWQRRFQITVLLTWWWLPLLAAWFDCRRLTQLTAAELEAAMLSSAHCAVAIGKLWQQQANVIISSSSTGQQLPTLMAPTHWFPSFDVLVECLLLAPSPDMASSCLQLMTLLLQQMKAALQQHGSGKPVYGQIATLTLGELAPGVFTQVARAVHLCMQQTTSLKQRRQLLRLWAGLLTALMRGAGAWCALQ
jgi:hypothetical protein